MKLDRPCNKTNAAIAERSESPIGGQEKQEAVAYHKEGGLLTLSRQRLAS